MRRSLLLFSMCLVLSAGLNAQELYVSTEPASNMPVNSISLRVTSEVMPGSDLGLRIIPEIMVGITKNLMGHSILYISDVHQKSQKVEGFGVYAKYRFLSIDSLQRHFRMAVYGRFSSNKNPNYTFNGPYDFHSMSFPVKAIDEINLEGDNSGLQGGVVATQLIHKLALSGSGNFTRAFDNLGGYEIAEGQARESLSFTLSAGYLAYPKVYTNYKQPNLNVYLEFIGKTNPGRSRHFIEAAPALQLILNSRTRIDISKRFQLSGNMHRMTKNMFLLRVEHNLFNVF